MKKSITLRTMLNRMQDVPAHAYYAGHRGLNSKITLLASALEGLESMAVHRDPTETEAKHAQRVALAARKLEERVAAINGELAEVVRGSLERLDVVITEKAGLKPNEYAAEIRQAVRGMGEKQRLDVLHQAVKSGDAATVAALTGAPGVVTGIGSEVASKMLESYKQTHAPEETAASDSLMEHYTTALTAAHTAKQAALAAYDPAFIADVQKAQAEAAKAEQSFNEAVA